MIGFIRLFLEAVIVFGILMIFFSFGVLVGNGDIEGYIKNTFAEPNSLNCKNITSLNNASICLHKELTVFFSYNLSNVGEDMTLEELKSEGGVCSHYSKWYCDRAEELNFSCKKVSIDTGDFRHQFAVISNKEGYCVLDQTLTPTCFKLKNPEEQINSTEEYGKN